MVYTGHFDRYRNGIDKIDFTSYVSVTREECEGKASPKMYDIVDLLPAAACPLPYWQLRVEILVLLQQVCLPILKADLGL
ncbi:hypothetical protein GUJ93_ZPchr0001g29471, partial [Zizania palustris]